jgi:hypothetical protein
MAQLDLSAERVLAELAKIAFANLADFLVIAPDGSFRVDLSRATPDQLAALSVLTVNNGRRRDPEGGREIVAQTVKIKMASKLTALTKLGEYLGLFDKKKGKESDALTSALAEINRRGSSVPIAKQKLH